MLQLLILTQIGCVLKNMNKMIFINTLVKVYIIMKGMKMMQQIKDQVNQGISYLIIQQLKRTKMMKTS